MKAKEIFSLAIRVLGLVFLYHGLSALPTVIPLVFSSGLSTSIMGILMFGWPLLVAYWFLRGAPFIMRIAYPDTGSHSESGQDMAGSIVNKS